MGTTALHWCIKLGQTDLAAWLIEQGADIEAVGYKWAEEGETPLQLAQEVGRSELVQMLRQFGARG